MESNAFIEDTYENDFFWAFKVKEYSINTLPLLTHKIHSLLNHMNSLPK
jgi:hypothetical protein